MVEDVPDDGLPIVRVPPIPIHFRPDQRMNLSHNHLAGTNNYLSKTISLPRLVRAVRRVRSEFRPDVIHFVENYGPAMLALRPAFPRIPMTISAPTYQPNRPLYDLFLEASFAPFDTIVPFSDAYQRRLIELRYRPGRFRMVRGGMDTERYAPPTAAPPLAWLESLAMGIPILTTDIPGSEEAVVEGVSGLRVGSPEAASERLIELSSNEGQLQRLREGARKVAVDRYSVDRSLVEYLELWSSLANGLRGRAHPRKSVGPSDAPDAQ